MANQLGKEKQATIIASLCEDASIRAIERMTGVHRDTIMRLGVRVGQACGEVHDATMRGLPSKRLEVDEIWGFVGKKEKAVTDADDAARIGDAWTFVAIDPESKAVPGYFVGKRDFPSTYAFISDLAERTADRIQLSSDGMASYQAVVEQVYGDGVDYGQIVKTYGLPETPEAARRYSPPIVTGIRKTAIQGNPDMDLLCTSIIERQNLTMRMHCRRLTRLTNAFSKKWENFQAAVSLHFAYYNFVKIHSTIRCTPAMALGVTDHIWTVADLVNL